MFKKKATGKDGIPNEVWIHGEGVMNALVKIIKKVWTGEGIPED